MMQPATIDDTVSKASKRPWSYHNKDGQYDWIEDANGSTILENVGHLDGPLVVACVNDAFNREVERELVRYEECRASGERDAEARFHDDPHRHE